MSNPIDKKLEVSMLLQTYGGLLTDKQREYLNLYINEDLSLNEISDDYNVSRAAIYDAIHKATDILEKYETSFHVLAKQEQLQNIVEKYKASNNEEVKQIIKEIEEIL
ncbi:YlxM family DNA-binding protein [Mesoplasma lactucae]|uniref:UPF0122 protein CP520_02020 n=1 Tax=Mesoplasma lactucae ATCC 49193 TaxID=81460 RepID=A0A291IS03_9MOLU|nr:sigma factor-like helix-turn-helix DNA-binding protein [Mesoplasma lactucae]ATG97524.1 DNA-binding protein [Mesoplasma lactucae ATCC 49193]ATZ20020.1 DNA-binding protein [Mesoplasma lactucae ATCC 49193]MCL8217029.1 hypothetical protein [Mesoplasma lactucae ATCC 49193]